MRLLCCSNASLLTRVVVQWWDRQCEEMEDKLLPGGYGRWCSMHRTEFGAVGHFSTSAGYLQSALCEMVSTATRLQPGGTNQRNSGQTAHDIHYSLYAKPRRRSVAEGASDSVSCRCWALFSRPTSTLMGLAKLMDRLLLPFPLTGGQDLKRSIRSTDMVEVSPFGMARRMAPQ